MSIRREAGKGSLTGLLDRESCHNNLTTAVFDMFGEAGVNVLISQRGGASLYSLWTGTADN